MRLQSFFKPAIFYWDFIGLSTRLTLGELLRTLFSLFYVTSPFRILDYESRLIVSRNTPKLVVPFCIQNPFFILCRGIRLLACFCLGRLLCIESIVCWVGNNMALLFYLSASKVFYLCPWIPSILKGSSFLSLTGF